MKQWWLRESLGCLQRDLKRLGVQLYTRTGKSTEELRNFLCDTGADAVFWNRCYEPDLLTRDEELRAELLSEGLTAESFKAELLVEPWELRNTEVNPRYETFHSYMRAWMTFAPPPQPFPCPSRLTAITSEVKSVGISALAFDIPHTLEEVLQKTWRPGSVQAKAQLDKFLNEVFPAFGNNKCRRHFDGTSRLSPHIRFGELSPRRMYHSTRMRVSRWDQGSMLSLAASRKLSLAMSNGSTKQERMKASLRESLESGREANREQEPQGDTRSSPLTSGTHAKQEESVGDNGGRGRPPPTPPEKPAKTNFRHMMRSAAVVRRLALPPISQSARAFLKNLCLRDFSYHILFHNPDFHTKPLIPEYVNFPWAEDKGSFTAWQTAKTGYPIVDAAMRELRATGWIHNRMRFLLACFLTKYLLLPWSRGLKEFYGLLLDGDHSSNALGWQWTAGSNTYATSLRNLISPIKSASQHDPRGSYVRQWLPELANLPTNFVHEPWKAPADVLHAAGVELGTTYPNRIVMLKEARVRAFEAMRLMKQIFSASGVSRNLEVEDEEDRVMGWREDRSEVFPLEESAVPGTKRTLLPCLWALLQSDQEPTYLSSSSSGSDPLIAIDTASLTEGALAVPMDDQQESIENALLTAHNHGPPPEVLVIPLEAVTADDRALGDPIYPQEKNCETESMMVGTGSDNLPVGHLGEPLKYHDSEVCTFPESEKVSDRQAPMEADGSRVRTDSARARTRPPDTVQVGAPNACRGSATQALNPSVPYPHQPQHQLPQFHQLQQLHKFQLQHHMHVHQQRQQQETQQHHRAAQQQRTSQHTSPHQHIHYPNSALPQRQQPHVHAMADAIYGQQGCSNGSLPSTSLAGVPMPGAPVMMGPATGSQDLGASAMFTGGDPGSSVYAHPLGLGQFYGFPPVMPILNAPAANGSERNDGILSSATTDMSKLPAPGMMPMPYGMYPGNMFEQNVLGGTHQAGNNHYASSQPQMQGGRQSPYRYSPQMYFPHTTPEIAPAQGNGHVPHRSSPSIPPQSRHLDMPSVVNAPNATAAAAVAAREREAAQNASSNANARTMSKSEQLTNETRNTPGLKPGFGVASRSVDTTKLLNSKVTNANTRLAQGRPRGRSNARSKAALRRKGSASNGIAKNRNEVKSSSNGRGQGSEGRSSTAQEKGPKEGIQSQGTTLKARQEMLASVLGKEDHQFHGFAKYLSSTYELTASTDRKTSKDYIRLCNLKDDYHKQCKSDKLKIYGIKSFFSKVLNLDVTGEWDRHNHGGVRGPYVYGIRPRRSTDPS